MSAVPRVLDVVTRTALLGVQFWDRATGRAVADELELRDTRWGVRAYPGPSGVFAFHALPGLAASAAGAGDQAFWASPPAVEPLTLEVVDRARRFLPFRFDAVAPTHGLFAEDCGLAGSPPEWPVAGVPLFSAPSRLVPAGLAVVRADLWDTATGAPAAWAVLEVTPAGTGTYRGIADERGRVAVLLPYPEPAGPGLSPHAAAGGPLLGQTWPVGVAVRCSPPAAGGLPAPGAGVPPDLCTVLTQPLTAPLPPATLSFGAELVLRTAALPVLHVSSA